jgi:hypothetical protein
MNKIITKHLLFNYGNYPYQCWTQHLGISSAYTLAKQINRNVRFPVPVLSGHINYKAAPIFMNMLKNFKYYHKWLGTVVKISFTTDSCYMYIKWRVPPPNLDKIKMSPSFNVERLHGLLYTPTALLHVAIVENPNIPDCGKLDYE